MDNISWQSLTEPLTHRELELLRLIADGLSNQDIGKRLFISLGTVKWYLKQIYGKLHVRSRTQAIATARAAGLLEGRTANIEAPILNHNLPQQPTAFIGRTDECAGIARHLEDPACRLLTVVGPGGIGKTRLALQAAEQQIKAFAQGVYFVSLAPLTAPESIVSALAEAIHFSFYPAVEPRRQLLDYLRARQMLLLFDNFEHLLAGASLVAEILEAAPKIKVLATSREHLNLQAETLLFLDGMAYPAQESAEDVDEYSAVRLFVQSARQVQPDFPVTAGNLDAIADICRQVQGMPLGILLAAAWVGVLSAQEIAEEIQNDLDFLGTDQRDLPERQRSLRAAFNHSWKLLAEEERQVFKRLAVFRGSFTRDAARHVAGASLKSLLSLVNKSLLRRDASSGRYEIHELLRQYGEDQLNAVPGESEQIKLEHCAYYADYMEEQWKSIISLRQGSVLRQIRGEFTNVLEAWNYAAVMRKAAILRGMARSLFYFCDKHVPHSEGQDFFGRAAAALEAKLHDQETEIVIGLMLSMQACLSPSSRHGKILIEKSLTILRQYDCPEETAYALFVSALITGFNLRQYAEGERAAREGLQIARENHIQWLIGHCLFHVGVCLRLQGDLEQARQFGEECRMVSAASGDVWVMAANALVCLGGIAMDVGDYHEAERQLEQGLRWYQELESGGYPWACAFACTRLGEVALSTQEFAKAHYWLQRSLDYREKAGRGTDRLFYEALRDVTKLCVAQGRTEDALEIISALVQVEYPPENQYLGDLANAALAELQSALSEEIFAAAVERGKALDLETVVADFLAS